MTKARLLLLHPHLLSSLVGPRGPPNKVGLTELKLRLNVTDTETSKKLKVLCSVIEEWEKDDQYNGSPPRPAPRGPRTPPGPPPPDDDDEEQVHVTGLNCPVVSICSCNDLI